jgi:enoyl-CoA hydratase/carnithine racemase
VPVIAAVEGFVLGGGVELAPACDLRIASSTAEFGFPEASLGLAMDLGGGQKLPGFVGEVMAKYLLLTGERIDAERALEIGLIEERVPEEEFDDRIAALEDRLADHPTCALALVKRQVQAVRPAHLDREMGTAIHHAIAAYHEDKPSSESRSSSIGECTTRRLLCRTVDPLRTGGNGWGHRRY